MSGFVSRWVVRERHDVGPADLDDAGVRADAFERWMASASAAYLRRCTEIERRRGASGCHLRSRIAVPADVSGLGRPTYVVVSAGVTEVRPHSFTMRVRVRSFGGSGDGVVNAACEITLEDQGGEALEIGDDIRDELIALEHAAKHTN